MLEALHKFSAKLAKLVGDTREEQKLKDGKRKKHNKLQTIETKKVITRKKLSAFFEQHSLSGLLHYETFNPESDLFINKKSIGFILEASTLTGASEETVNILSTILTDTLPPNADLQFLLWASDKIGDELTAFEKQRSGHGEIFEWLARKRTDFLKSGTLNSLSKHGSYLIRDFRLFVVVSIPRKNVNDDSADLINIRDDIQSSLKSINIYSEHLAIERFISLMSDLLNPSSSIYPTRQNWNEYDSLSLQLTDPEYHLEVLPNKLVIQSEQEDKPWEIRCFTVKDFPKAMTQWKMTDSIGQMFNNSLQLPCPVLISLNVRVLDHNKTASKAQLNFINKDNKAKSPLAKFIPNIIKEQQDWDFVRERLNDGDKLVKIYYQVIMYSPAHKATHNERKIKDLYNANGWKLRKEIFVQFQSWLAAMPMRMTEGMYQDVQLLGRLRTVTAFNVANIAPLQGEWKGTPTPSLILPSRRGQIATWNPFDGVEGNYNIAIAAKSGSGKSVFVQEYIVAILGSGGRVWTIDVGRSYEKTCKILGGEFINFSSSNPININMFTNIKDFDNEALPMLKPLLSAMARPNDKVTREEENFIEKAIKEAWQTKRNKATITTVVDWLKTQQHLVCQNLALLLYPYTKDGMYGRYFEGDCSINLNSRFVVLELQELKAKRDLQKIVLLVVMYQISQAMYLCDRSQIKSCVIDEAWDLLGGDNDGAAEFIETGYRTARRFRGNFVTITQSINDYYKNATSLAAFENSEYNIILAQKAESLNKLKQDKRLEMDGYTERIYKSLKMGDVYSECVIKGPSGISVHRILLDPYARILYSSKGEEFEAVNRLCAQGKDIKEAVEIVARKFHT
jgi:conjugal transfer ATP-binding protein TraC